MLILGGNISFKLYSCVALALCASSVYGNRADEFDKLLELDLKELLNISVTTGQRSSETTYRQLPVPVRVITRVEIERSGYTELGKVLQRLEASFNYPRAAITDLTDHARPASLRGLSPAHTLILVNGKRLHHNAVLHINNSMGRGSTSSDINTIPIAAIDRIEILKDGASAQYGSDAIAGVINVILAQDSQQIASATIGQTEAGDGELHQFDLSMSGEFAGKGGWQLTFEAREREPTNRSDGDPRTQYFDGDPRNEANPVNGQRYGDPETSDRLLWFSGEYNLSNTFALYGHSGWNQRTSESPAFFRRPLDNRNDRRVYPDGFLPIIAAELEDKNLVVGIKDWHQIDKKRWNWDLSLSYGENQLDSFVQNSVNVSMGPESPTHFYSGTLVSDQLLIAAETSRLFNWAGFELETLLGSQWRRDGYQIIAGEEASYIHGGYTIADGPNAGGITNAGAQGFPGFKPANAINQSRNNMAVYAEVKTQLTDALLLQGALRYEDYSDFGGNTDGKFALAYTPSESWLIRSSLGSGFRAPSLAQSHYRATSTSFFAQEAFDVGTFGVDEPVAVALGALPLKPEKSKQFNLGLAYFGVENLAISFDYFYTEIKDRIILSGAITRDADTFGQQVVDILEQYQIGGARFFSNAIDTKTTGFDFTLEYSQDWGYGNTRLGLQFHENDTKITAGPRTPELLNSSVDVLFDRREQMRISDGQPGSNINLSLTHQYKDWHFNIKQIKFGSITTGQRNNDPLQDFDYDSKWITDVHISYKLENNLSLSLGGHNVFDIYPDKRDEGSSSIFGTGKVVPYHQLSPFGFNGAFYYLTLSYQF